MPGINIKSVTNKSEERSKKQSKDEILCKKCPTCFIVKTPRVFHCNICNCCISVHDHHCFWLGCCIAQRNHRYFMMYVTSTLLLCLYTVGLNVYYMQNREILMTLDDANFLGVWVP